MALKTDRQTEEEQIVSGYIFLEMQLLNLNKDITYYTEFMSVNNT